MALTTRYRFANAPTSAILGDSSLGWTTAAGTLAAAGTSLSVASSSTFPTDGEFDILIGSRNTTTGVWTNAEIRHVTAVSGTTWTVSTGALDHVSGESISHVLTASGIQHNPGSLTDSGDIPYLDASGRMARLAAPSDGAYNVEWTSGVPSWASPSGGTAHEVLSATHSDSLTASVVRGDVIVGNSTPKWSRLGIGAAGTVLHSDGTDPGWALPSFDPLYTTGRLTLVSGNAVPTADQVAKGTLYYTSIANDGVITTNHFQCVIYDGAALQRYDSAEISLALTITSGKNYDVFIYDNSGTLTLELSAAWTDDTTRANALAAQSGQVVKSGATTRRWIGTIRASGTDTTEDSGGLSASNVGAKRFVYNEYNQVTRGMGVTDEDNWSYTSQTIRQANGQAGNQIEMIFGSDRNMVRSFLAIIVQIDSNSLAGVGIGVGLDSTSAYILPAEGIYAARTTAYFDSHLSIIQTGLLHQANVVIGLGYHRLTWLESGSDGNCTFISSLVNGISAVVLM